MNSMELAIWLVSGGAIFFTVIFLHELGHYLYGRFMVGIPSNSIRIVMRWPQYVALRMRGNGEWLSPDNPQYRAVYKNYDSKLKRLPLYIASGHIFWITLLTLSCFIMLILDIETTRLVRISAIVNGFVLLLDISSIMTNRETGDVSSLWKINRLYACSIIALIILSHVLFLALT